MLHGVGGLLHLAAFTGEGVALRIERAAGPAGGGVRPGQGQRGLGIGRQPLGELASVFVCPDGGDEARFLERGEGGVGDRAGLHAPGFVGGSGLQGLRDFAGAREARVDP